MRKLRLDMEALKVESFEVATIRSGVAGTVWARESYALIEGCGGTGEACTVDGDTGGIGGWPTLVLTCPQTCVRTCEQSCGGSCGFTCPPVQPCYPSNPLWCDTL